MKDSTENFIELMRERYGPEEKAGRGNVLSFGGQVAFAIGNSKQLRTGKYFFAIQNDVIQGKINSNLIPPLGIFVALICGDEQNVLILPQPLISEAMKDSPTDRINVEYRTQNYYLRVTGKPLVEITEYVNNYPQPNPKEKVSVQPANEVIATSEQQQLEVRDHVRIQWMLIQFGQAAGYSVWIPPSDKGYEFNSERFSSITISELPNFGFDAATNQIISNIDVLWLEGNVIHKAFEIESTTSVYSGLLRMSDLVLAQPNITIDLHIVAPLRRRELVRRNILRPTFFRLRPKCSYISFEEVTTKYVIVKDILRKQHARIRDLLESEKF